MRHFFPIPSAWRRGRFSRLSACKLFVAGMAALAAGCTGNDGPDPDARKADTSVLLYAVASNDLSYDFHDDINELLKGAEDLDPERSDIWVYSLTPKQDPTLRRVVTAADGTRKLEVVKEYDRETFSTDPRRISQVIADYLAESPAGRRGLILWSHATGWQYDESDHVVPEPPADEEGGSARRMRGAEHPVINYSYGADQYRGATDFCNLLELDEAIPASTFDFLWFDCCYMSSIEVVYQLRHKAPFIVAYPTEVAAEGMPYDITIPHIAAPDFDLVEAARAMAAYYLDDDKVMTIAVIDTAHLPRLAAAAEKAVGGERVPMLELQKYSRRTNGPFFDFGQYTTTWGAARPDQGWDEAEFREALDATVIYKAASERGFDRRPILPEHYSGISCHYFEDFGTEESEYYKRLDWYRDVYPRYREE